MDKNISLIISSVIFGIISIIHLVRYFLNIEIIVGGYIVPMQASIYGFIITFILCVWMFTASMKK